MCSVDNVETPITIKTMLQKYKTSAEIDKEHDIHWYAGQLIKVIDELTTAGWPNPRIKEQVAGRLSSVVPQIG
jgi:hypothetical protein